MDTKAEFLCRPDGETERLLEVLNLDQDSALIAWRNWCHESDRDLRTPGIYELLPAIYYKLSGTASEDPSLRIIRGIYRRTFSRNTVSVLELMKVVRSLQASGVKVMLIKGVSLLPYYDHNIALRTMADVDILIPPEAVAHAFDVLNKHGWSPYPRFDLNQDPDGLTRYLHGADFAKRALRLDLHWHPVHYEIGRYDVASLWSNSINCRILDTDFLSPCRADALLLAVIHGIRPQTNRSCQWILDCEKLLAGGLSPAQVERLRHQALRYGVGYMLCDVFGYLAAHDVETPPVDTLRPRSGLLILQRLEYKNLLRPAPIPSFTTRFAGFVLKLRRDWVATTIDRFAALVLTNAERLATRLTVRSTQWVLSRAVDAPTWAKPIYRAYRVVAAVGFSTASYTPLASDTEVSFGMAGEGFRYLRSGWSRPEKHTTWSDAYCVSLGFRLTDATPGDYRIGLRLWPYIDNQMHRSRLDVLVNRAFRGRLEFSEHALTPNLNLFMRRGRPAEDVNVLIQFLLPDARIPAKRRSGPDARLLGLCVEKMVIVRLAPWNQQDYLVLARQASGRHCLGTGWWPPEPNGTWSASPESTLRVPLENPGDLAKLIFEMTSHPNIQDFSLAIHINGEKTALSQLVLKGGVRTKQTMVLSPRGEHRGCNYIDIVFRSDMPVRGGEQDRRLLGFMLHKIGANSS